ncbi:MAG: septum formation family protein [Chloroflexota bacterium]
MRIVHRTPRPARATAALALAALAGGALAPAALAASPGAGASPAVTGTWFDGMEPGACFAYATDAAGAPDLSRPATFLDCRAPHPNEVAARIPLGAGAAIPDDVDAAAQAGCDAAVTAFLGRPVTETPLQSGTVWPDASDWSKGARDAVCVVGGQDLIGSAAGGTVRAPGWTLAAWWQQEGAARLWLFDGGTGEPATAITDADLPAVLGPGSWTPDGGFITAEIALDDDDHDQVLVAADATGTQPLVGGPGRQVGAAIAPDGITLAYATNAAGEYDIVTQDLAGGDPTVITDFPGRDATPRWSPDGTRILFRRVVDGRSEIWLMGRDGSDPHRLVDVGAAAYDPRWMPDGSAILFTTDAAGSMDIWTAGADGSDPHPLTDHPGAEEYPTISADGSRIAFQSDRLGTPTIWVINADGSDASLLIGQGPVGYPSFSPLAAR